MSDSVLSDSQYEVVHSCVRPPEQAYAFVPDIEDEIFMHETKHWQRLIFSESDGYMECEEEGLKKLEEAAQKQKYEFPDWATKSFRMRWL